MHVLNIDMYQTLAFAVGVLFIGGFLKKKISILEKFCIPAPVIGGLILHWSPACFMCSALWNSTLMKR